MKKSLFIIPVLLFFLFGYFISIKTAESVDCQGDPDCLQLQNQINKLTDDLQASERATAPNEAQLNVLKSRLLVIEDRINFIEQDVVAKKKIIEDGYVELAKQKDIFDKVVRAYYIKNYSFSPLLIFISSKDASNITQVIAYQKRGADNDRVIIGNIALKIEDLEQKKKELETEETRLDAVKLQLEPQKQQLQKLVEGAKQYQATLSNQIAQLSAQQQQILDQKYASLGISLSAYNMQGGCRSDLLPGAPDPGFSPKIGFFTYGVPNRVGLNQFGALGRSQTGKSYADILNAYYQNYHLECRSLPNNRISVDGYGNISVADYLKGLGEMPSAWGDQGGYEAFKAQIVAAASYAYAYTNNGSGSICTTDKCQVYTGSNKGGKWEQAVNDIAGKCGGNGVQVMLENGSNQPVKAWYSSTHGGYVFTSQDIGWSGTSFTKRTQDASGPVNSFSDLQSKAYDKDSPWFYCDWGSRDGTAWLKPSEVADIVNVMLLVQADPSTKEHLYQTDKPNPAGTDTWSADRVKSELRDRDITPFDSFSGAGVDADFGIGKVNTIHVNDGSKSTSFSGDFFKTYFNLRAPKNIQIVGPLYNVEQR